MIASLSTQALYRMSTSMLKPFAVACLVAVAFLAWCSCTKATPGELDGSFGSNGVVETDLSAIGANFFSVATQVDGKIIAAGRVRDYFSDCGSYSYCFRFLLARYNTDGSLDQGFGGGGIVNTSITTGDSDGRAVAVLPNGKIIVAGYSAIASAYGPAMARYNDDGSLDTAFGNNGRVSTFISGRGATISSIAIQANGAILLGGTTQANSGINDFLLMRYFSNGSLDQGFGNGGSVITDTRGYDDQGHAITVQQDGKILLVGESYANSTYPYEKDFALIRYKSNGDLDPTFGDSGKTVTSFGRATPHAVAVQPNGMILVGGSSRAPNQNQDYFTLVRYQSDGALDASFGTDGITQTAVATNFEAIRSIHLQEDGKILATGSANYAFAVVRYEEDGTLNDGFGVGGISTVEAPGYPYSGALQADEKVVLVGGTTLVRFDVSPSSAPSPTFQVTPSSTAGGTVEPSTIQLLAQGGTTSFTLFPEAGYEIEPVTGTCGGSLSGSTFTIDAASADCTVDANFGLIPGTVSPSPPVIAAPTVRSNICHSANNPEFRGLRPSEQLHD